MKRQGKYGFTWDSKAEEWAAWAVSCLDHNAPRSWRERRNLARFANDMLDEHDGIARPVDPYRAIIWRDEPRKAPLWPFAAIAVILTVAAAVVWGWG